MTTDNSRADALTFRKKPVAITAVQFTHDMAMGHVDLPEGVQFGGRNCHPGRNELYSHTHYVQTLEGRMSVEIGDWIITGVKGERYPCKPDIFAMTYEPVEQHEAAPASGDSLTLSGAQLLEALEFIAPDRDAEQLESKVTIQRGTGHTGHGMYCWSTEYPEEGAILLDGTSIAQPEPSDPLEGTGNGAVPEDCDVRKILLRVTPGDGDGHEEYARNMGDVERLLSEMGERLEDFESARAPRTEVAGAVPRSVIFSLECTANWLEGGCDPKAAAHEIRLNLEKLRAPAADAAAAPADDGDQA